MASLNRQPSFKTHPTPCIFNIQNVNGYKLIILINVNQILIEIYFMEILGWYYHNVRGAGWWRMYGP